MCFQDEEIEQYWERLRDIRARDYLPTAGTPARPNAGHSSEFLQFITDQLIPWVNTTFRVSALRSMCLEVYIDIMTIQILSIALSWVYRVLSTCYVL